MAKYTFEDFLACVDDEYEAFVTTVHKMLKDDYRVIIRQTKSGLSVSYSQPKWVRILCFSLRGNALAVHINIEYHANYMDVLNRLPEEMLLKLDKAADCRKLLGTVCGLDKLTGFACGWDNCEPGYDFHIGWKRYQKCRFHCLKTNVTAENIPILLELVTREAAERRDAIYRVRGV